MIDNTLADLEARIQRADSVTPEKKAELLQLLATLRAEIGSLADSHQEEAQSIAGFAQISTHEATREKRNPELVQLSLEGLSSSVGQLEQSHPNLVRIVNRICETLSSLGI